MSRIALLDTSINLKYIKNMKQYEHIDLGRNNIEIPVMDIITHGTSIAMVLGHCSRNYELINIEIYSENKKDKRQKPACSVENLAEALHICNKLDVDIVSLSAVSSNLYDSKFIYDIVLELSQKVI